MFRAGWFVDLTCQGIYLDSVGEQIGQRKLLPPTDRPMAKGVRGLSSLALLRFCVASGILREHRA